jgi:hypothetical protein
MQLGHLGDTAFDIPFINPTWFFVFLAWTIVWKGLALWNSAQHKHQWWFVALLLINTAGLLEIFYLFFILKKKFSDLFPVGKIE